MADPHLASVEVTVVAEDWSGELVVRSVVNGDVANRNVPAGEAVTVENVPTVDTSRDRAISTAALEAELRIRFAPTSREPPC